MQLFKGINVVSISVTDLDLAREFYGKVLGLGIPLYDLPEMGWIEFSTGAPYGNIALTLAEASWLIGSSATLHSAWVRPSSKGLKHTTSLTFVA